MTRVALLPHRTTDEGVRAGPWTAVIDGIEQPRSSAIAGWDHRRVIELRSEVVVDLEVVRRVCGLGDADPVALIATWQSSATNIRTVAAHFPIENSASFPVGFDVDPRLVGGELTLVRSIVLAAPGTSPDPLTAHRVGAVLWREPRAGSLTVALEGVTHISTEALDFAHLPDVDAKAAWQLEADFDDMHATPSRAFQLFVNTSHPSVDRLLSDVDDELNDMAQSVLRWDVARQLVDRALDDDGFVNEFGSYEADSTGGAMQAFLERWFAGTTAREMREMREQHPTQYEGLLQAKLRLLRAP